MIIIIIMASDLSRITEKNLKRNEKEREYFVMMQRTSDALDYAFQVRALAVRMY